MSNIKEIASRINSVTSTQQLTQAMSMVAAARLSKVQQKVLGTRNYAEKVSAMLSNLTANTHQSFDQRYLEERAIKKNWLLLVMTSDRGLCGSFNTNVLRKALNCIQESIHTWDPAQITIVPIGRKALNFFQKEPFKLLLDYVALSHHLDFERIGSVATWLTDAFLRHTYDQILLIYNKFQSAVIQTPVVEQLLPIHKLATTSSQQEVIVEYIYEPSSTVFMEVIVPHALQIQLYKALLESNAAEYGARMTTMSKATDNAEELLKDLRLTYNKTRQGSITREIAEVVAGAEMLMT